MMHRVESGCEKIGNIDNYWEPFGAIACSSRKGNIGAICQGESSLGASFFMIRCSLQKFRFSLPTLERGPKK